MFMVSPNFTKQIKEGEVKMKEKFSEDATKLNDEKKMRLVDAYGEGEDIEFKMPRIKFHMGSRSSTNGRSPNGAYGHNLTNSCI